MEEMDQNGEFMSRGMDVITDCAMGWDDDENPLGFKLGLVKRPGQKATRLENAGLDILRDLVDRTGLNGMSSWNRVRDMVKKANVFTEVVYGDNLDRIERVVQFENSWQIDKHIDSAGNLKSGDPEKALKDPKEALNSAYTQKNEMGKVTAAFWPFQMDHWVFGRGGGKVYCDPMLGPAIRGWKRTQAQEDALGIARISRAWDTDVHHILVPVGASEEETQKKVDQYKENMTTDKVTAYDSTLAGFKTTPRNSPMNVARDYFIVTYYAEDGKMIPGDIEKLQPSTAALENINDIYWGVMNQLVCLGVPMDYMSIKIGSRAFIDKGQEKTVEAFQRMLRRLQFCHTVGLKFLFDIELLLQGQDPRKQAWVVKYPSIRPEAAEMAARIVMNESQAATYWFSMGVPPDLIGPLLSMDPDAVEQWRQHMVTDLGKTQMKMFKPVDPAGTPEPVPAPAPKTGKKESWS
jgi:hypothetical protein